MLGSIIRKQGLTLALILSLVFIAESLYAAPRAGRRSARSKNVTVWVSSFTITNRSTITGYEQKVKADSKQVRCDRRGRIQYEECRRVVRHQRKIQRLRAKLRNTSPTLESRQRIIKQIRSLRQAINQIINFAAVVDFEVKATEITNGPGGPELPVRASYMLTDMNPPPVRLFGDQDLEPEMLDTLGIEDPGQFLVVFGVLGVPDFENPSYITEVPSTDPNAAMVVANGDNIFDLMAQKGVEEPFDNQEPIEEIIGDYIDADGNVTLESNQFFLLYELGSPNPDVATYDLQDLVLLVTANGDVRTQEVFTVVDRIGANSDSTDGMPGGIFVHEAEFGTPGIFIQGSLITEPGQAEEARFVIFGRDGADDSHDVNSISQFDFTVHFWPGGLTAFENNPRGLLGEGDGHIAVPVPRPYDIVPFGATGPGGSELTTFLLKVDLKPYSIDIAPGQDNIIGITTTTLPSDPQAYVRLSGTNISGEQDVYGTNLSPPASPGQTVVGFINEPPMNFGYDQFGSSLLMLVTP